MAAARKVIVPIEEVEPMYARIIRAHVAPENFDQVLAATRDHNIPMVTQMPGFRSGYWTGDRQTGTIATCVVFDSQDGIRAAEAGMERMRPLVAPLNVQFDSVENLEVFAARAATEPA
jgi:antibiotic biosynthesis monooxygenase (ABM) superfamily enzyme